MKFIVFLMGLLICGAASAEDIRLIEPPFVWVKIQVGQASQSTPKWEQTLQLRNGKSSTSTSVIPGKPYTGWIKHTTSGGLDFRPEDIGFLLSLTPVISKDGAGTMDVFWMKKEVTIQTVVLDDCKDKEDEVMKIFNKDQFTNDDVELISDAFKCEPQPLKLQIPQIASRSINQSFKVSSEKPTIIKVPDDHYWISLQVTSDPQL